MRLGGIVAVFVLIAIVAMPVAAASSISGYQPPQNTGSEACPPTALLPGEKGANGSLIAFFQPGPEQGYTCGLANGGTLVGTELIVALYAPTEPGNGTVPIGVEEFSWSTETLTRHLANNTTVEEQIPIKIDLLWSNTTVAASPGSPEQFALNVPEPTDQTNLTVEILGAVLNVPIVAPGAGIPIPSNYPQLLTHDFGWVVWVVVFFVVGIGIATALRMRARHVERLVYFGAAGLFVAFGFGAWFLVDYPLSAVPIGSSPEAVVAAPVVLISIYFWLALFPTEAKLYQVRYPVADTRDGMPGYDVRRFRLYEGTLGSEYIGPGGAGQFLRILGVRTYLDDRVLTNTPHRVRNMGFQSIKHDVYAEYLSPGKSDNGQKVLEVVPPRTFWLPWRERTRAAIEEYHTSALKGRVNPPEKVGLFVYVSPSRAFVSASGWQGGLLVQKWISGTLHVSKIAEAFEKVLVAFTTLRVSLKAEALNLGQKLAFALRSAEDYPDSPIAIAALEDLATREEAAFLDQTEWFHFLEEKVAKKENPKAPPSTPPAAEEASQAQREPRPIGGRPKRNSGPTSSGPAGTG